MRGSPASTKNIFDKSEGFIGCKRPARRSGACCAGEVVRLQTFMSDNPNSPSNPAEPLFNAISQTDADFQSAYDRAAETVPQFIEHVESGEDGFYSAKLRFRDPDESERLGEDRFALIWLTSVHYHAKERIFSGTFFEVPHEFQKWHHVGQCLSFEPEDIFDWMVLREGHLHGGFTLRVSRSKRPEAERDSYDRYIGVSVYEPLPV